MTRHGIPDWIAISAALAMVWLSLGASPGSTASTLEDLVDVQGAPPLDPQDATRLLRSRDVNERLTGVRALSETSGDEKAERALLGALKDKDWEVIEATVEALATAGGDKSWKPLHSLALNHPARRIRRAAARTLAARDIENTAQLVAKQVKGREPVRPAEALAALALAAAGAEGSPDSLRDGLDKALSSKDLPVRVAAAPGIVAFIGDDRAQRLVTGLGREIELAAAMLDALRLHPRAEDVPVLVALLGAEELDDVLARRVRATLVACVRADVAAADDLLGGLAQGSTTARTRFARLVGDLGRSPRRRSGELDEKGEALVAADLVVPPLSKALSDDDSGLRAAALRGLQAVGTAAALDPVAALLAGAERDARVRDIALRVLVQERSVEHDETRALAIASLRDPDDRIREDAAVALGSPAAKDAVPDLIAALSDPEWGVALCAAVSLGKTRDAARALAPLMQLREESDPKRAAAGLVGLGHLGVKEVVPHLLDTLGSRSATERQVALGFLDRMTTERISPKKKSWKDWWDANESGFSFRDREAEARNAKKYGYAPSTIGVYEDLDVLVFESRGDHIQELLGKLKIEHRMTQLGKVPESGVQPFGIYVANCTGECQPADVEELKWFVKAGGYLFASCWALEFAAQACYPGMVRRFKTSGQVLDNVLAAPCSEHSPFLDGVFPGGSRPVYRLEGSFLIDVLDPERVEVLIDSPQAATRWGCGNLACWFPAGHGLILDSANHFDLQGLDRIDDLKRPEDRMAWAVDHMAVDWADLRDLSKRKVWSKAARAAEEVEDLSAFRFLTNFVRHKRMRDR